MITPSPTRTSQDASTLVLAMFVVALLAVFIGLAFDFTASTSKLTRRATDYSSAQALANGALEATYKKWQVYMAGNQSAGIPTSPTDPTYLNGSNYTATANLNSFVASEMTLINAAASASGYVVTNLSVQCVDRADAVQPCQADTYSSKGPLANVPGWTAKTYSYCATATVSKIVNSATKATDPGFNVSVSRYFQQAFAPLFQAMLFFQDDLELHPGPAMTLYGLVHTNSNLYAAAGAAGSLTFNSNVSYHGNQSSFTPASNYKFELATGYAEGVTQTLYNTESGNWNNFNAPSYATGRNSQLSNVQNLSPLGTDVGGAIDTSNPNASGTHEIIERPDPISPTNPSLNKSYADPDAFKANRIYNSAGLRIFINHSAPYKTPGNGNAQNIHVYTPVSLTNLGDSTEIIPGDGTAAHPYNIANQIINSITVDSSTGDIYDFRQGGYINASTVDMSKLTPALNAYSAYNGVVYITDLTNADTTGNTGNADAIRVKNGGVLPDAGLTLATDGGVYIQGDYNTGTTYDPVTGLPVATTIPVSDTGADPTKYTVSGYAQKNSAVMGDAVMILSNAWKDSTSNLGSGSNVATPTTINTAIVSGSVLTTSSTASGGAHNFPRFLENWSGQNFTYHGSMCELYASTHFTGTYGKANVYSPPNRRWYFDDSFLSKPPPGNLCSTTFSRGRWVHNTNL